MRAAIVRQPGSPEALQIEEASLPEAPAGWVRIRVKAIGLSRSEIYARRGDYPEVSFPRVLGTECIGVVDDASDSALQPGSLAVALMGGMGRLYDGCYAEYVSASTTHVLPLTSSLSWEVLAALPKSYLAAHQALETLDLRAGQTLLIRGGTSSVGLCALTLAKERGARVLATTRSQDKVAALSAAGADTALLDTGSLEKSVRQVAPEGVSAALEVIGASTLRDSLLTDRPQRRPLLHGSPGRPKRAGTLSAAHGYPVRCAPHNLCQQGDDRRGALRAIAPADRGRRRGWALSNASGSRLPI